MLATACLLTEEDVALMQERARATGYDIVGNMDVSTECLSLSTSGFDDLPAEAQQCLKTGMEIHLREFGKLYLSAIHLGFSSGDMHKVCKAVEDSLQLLRDKLEKMPGPQ